MNLYLWDGSNQAFRAHCAFQGLTVEEQPVGATYGITSMLGNFVRDWAPGRIVMPFDISKSTYRLGLFPAYKGGRKENKQKQLYDDYLRQLDFLIDLVSKFGVTTIAEEARGVEADDVIAYVVSLFRAGSLAPEYNRVVIISSDKDLCALVGYVGPGVESKVVWYDPIKRNLVTPDNFTEQFGVTIEQYPDFKALKGDASDNISGVPGIGPKRAADLLREYGSIEALLQIKHQRIAQHTTALTLSRKLVALDLHERQPENPAWGNVLKRLRDVPVIAPDLVETLEALQFRSILDEWDDVLPRWEAFRDSPALFS